MELTNVNTSPYSYNNIYAQTILRYIIDISYSEIVTVISPDLFLFLERRTAH